MASLHGVEVKLARARHHAYTIETEWRAFCKREPYRFSVDVHDEGRKHVYRVEHPPAVPETFTATFGDFVHNLRSSLDHLAWQLVELNGNKPTETTQFPIRHQEFRYHDGVATPTVDVAGGVSAEALAIIKSVQPYNARHLPRGRWGREPHPDAFRRYLWHLHKLDVIDKHRQLVFSVGAFGGGIGIPGESPKVQFCSPFRALKHGEVVLVVTYPEECEPEADMRDAVQIVLGDGAPRGLVGAPVAVLIGYLYTQVELVLNEFRPMFNEHLVDLEKSLVPPFTRPVAMRRVAPGHDG